MRHNFFVIIMTMVSLNCVLASNVFAVMKDPHSLVVSLDKNQYSREEKVVVTIKNISDKSVWIGRRCSSLVNAILKKNVEQWESQDAFPAKLCQGSFDEVKANSSIQQEVSFDWFEHKYFRIETGTYKFQAAYSIVAPIDGLEPRFFHVISDEFTVETSLAESAESYQKIVDHILDQIYALKDEYPHFVDIDKAFRGRSFVYSHGVTYSDIPNSKDGPPSAPPLYNKEDGIFLSLSFHLDDWPVTQMFFGPNDTRRIEIGRLKITIMAIEGADTPQFYEISGKIREIIRHEQIMFQNSPEGDLGHNKRFQN